MTTFVLILTIWTTGDTFVLDSGMTAQDCQVRIAQAYSNDLQELGELTCQKDGRK